MNYRGIKTALKKLQDQGHTIPALNSKKEVLRAALAEIWIRNASEIAKASIEPTAPEVIEADPDVIVEPTAPSTATNYDTTPSVEIPSPEVTPAFIAPEHPALTEVREIAKGLEIAIIWTIAVIRSLIRFSTPHIKTALLAALRFTIYTAVLLQPKVELIAYTLGIWGMSIALKIIRNNRGWSIA